MEKTIAKIVKLLQFVLAIILGAMILINVLQMITRYFINFTLTWAEDFSVLSLYWILAFGTPMAWLLNAHVVMNVSDKLLGEKVKIIIWIIIQSLGFGVGCGLIVVGLRCVNLNKGIVMSIMGFDEMWRYVPLIACGILLSVSAALLLARYVVSKKQGGSLEI